MNWLATFGYGVMGGLCLELYHWYGLRSNTHFPTYARKPRYWLITAAMVCVGGIIPVLLYTSQGTISPLNSFILGLSAPSLLHKSSRSLSRTVVAGSPTENMQPESLRDFLM